ncbi:MAG: hypothetical protein JXA71_01865 [Chitinispirillaceae bacterium]|nr:hypothetical protein [Chitinispirillaceae bacterium]
MDYPDYKKLEGHYTALLPVFNSIREAFQRDLQDHLDGIEARITTKSRVKTFESYYQKLLRRLTIEKRTGEKSPIHDILALRVVCPFMEELARAENLVRSRYRTHEIERKGAGRTFREFGYNATHLIVEIPGSILDRYPQSELTTVEIQICTILQDAWAEVEHELIYKKKITPLDEPFRRKLAALNANLTLSDIIFQEIRDYQEQLHFQLEKRRSSFRNQLEEQQPGMIPQQEKKDHGGDDDRNKDGSRCENMDELLLEALHAHNRKDYSSAITIYSCLLEHDLEPALRAMLFIHRGMAWFAKTGYDKAVDDFRQATECEPGSSRAFYHLGIAHRVLENNAEALKALRTCIEINPYYFEGLFGLAGAFFEVEDFPAALEYIEKALSVKPDATAAVKFRTLVLSRMKL